MNEQFALVDDSEDNTEERAGRDIEHRFKYKFRRSTLLGVKYLIKAARRQDSVLIDVRRDISREAKLIADMIEKLNKTTELRTSK